MTAQGPRGNPIRGAYEAVWRGSAGWCANTSPPRREKKRQPSKKHNLTIISYAASVGAAPRERDADGAFDGAFDGAADGSADAAAASLVGGTAATPAVHLVLGLVRRNILLPRPAAAQRRPKPARVGAKTSRCIA